MTPEERVEAIWKLLLQHQPKLAIDFIKGEMLRHFQEASAEEQMRCYQVARGEADQWHALWRPVHREGDSLAEYGFLAAELIARLLSQSPD